MQTDSDKSKYSNIIRVTLLKQKKCGLGFLVRKRSKSPHVVVSELVSNGTAAESGLVQIGDVILKVNDVSLDDLGYDKSVEVLKAPPAGVAVVLILKGPEGYTSHLETRFNQDGSPRTVRITKPILHSNGFIGRIRKSLSASATCRSCETTQTQANCETVTWHGDDTRISRQNGDLHRENQCLDKSDLSQGSNEHTATHSTTFEPRNSRTNLIRSTKCSESNETANCEDTASHMNETVSNNNSPKRLSTDLQQEKIHRDGNLGKTGAMNGLGCTVDAVEALNKEEWKQCSQNIIDQHDLRSKGNKKWDKEVSVIKDDGARNSVNDNEYQNSVTKNNNREALKGSPLNDQNKPERLVLKGLENGTESGHGVLVSELVNGTSSENGSETIQKPYDEVTNLGGKVDKSDTAPTKSSSAKRSVKLRHVGEERPVCTDTLHQKAIEELKRDFNESEKDKNNNHIDRILLVGKTSFAKEKEKIKIKLLPFVTVSCPENNLKRIGWTLIELHTMLKHNERKELEPMPCTAKFCMGSVVDVSIVGSEPQSKQEVLIHAKDFINQYYQSIKRYNSLAHLHRWSEVEKSVIENGTYELTMPELTYGAKTAWRNAARCIGRIQWSKLQVFDARHITTARGMFEAICNHIKYGTNKGNIRSAITVFPPRTDGKHDFRVWNQQIIRYAGYKQEDGSIVGDPANVELTGVCQKFGWKGKGTRFDVLPLILQANGHDPEMFEIPSDLILEVDIKHPKFPCFAEMGIKWYALPAISNMVLDCGGLLFVAAPFNGWFMGTEIGARDLCDPFRYNLLEDIAKRMGFDTRKSSSLWKDHTLVEINVAVLYSYQSQGVTITDHHAASESFMKHLDNEQRLRGGCPADWVWVVPPMSASILPVFHQEMLCYKLKPSFEYQADAWKTHVWKKDEERTRSTSDRPRHKIGFRELVRAVKFVAILMGKALARRVKCVILYATETGKSEEFAKTLCQIFGHAFDAKVMCMNDYDVSELEHEALVLIVTSTFGNGDPPENGEPFAKHLFEANDVQDKLNKQTSYLGTSGESNDEDDIMSDDKKTGPLRNVRYSVFGLGSSAYPNFCAFAHYVDNILNDLGAERILKTMEGDELCGQEESFKNWAKEVFKAACESFCTGDDRAIQDAAGTLTTTDHNWKPETFRVTPAGAEKKLDIIAALSAVYGKNVIPCRFMERTQLQSVESDRQTMLIKVDTTNGSSEMLYQPGDHVAIYPHNSEKLVDAILIRLHNAPAADQFTEIEVLNERSTPLGTMKAWDPYTKLPACTLRTAFSRFLDITTPPTQTLLKIFATQASKDCDKESLETLANDSRMYEEWKYVSYPNIVQVLDQFPSLRIPPSLLLTQLPLLTARFYSISSSLKLHPGELHATIAVVKYRTQGTNGPLHEGVCSNWLNRLEVGDTIPCIVRHAPAFHMPEDPTVQIILVGPGTGIAPFRSFWQQRKIDMEMLPKPQSGTIKGWGKIYLYFGCRYSKMDDIYKEELKQMKNEGVLTEVHTALSRESDTPKTYVQTILKQNAVVVFNCIVREGGHFYVCGDVKMASDVTATLEKILSTEGDMTMQDAKNFVMKLRDSNRFHEDIFGVTSRSSEVTDRARDQAKKAWNYINSANKPRPTIDKETVAPIPSGESKAPKGKPKAPRKAMYTQETVG